MSTKDPYEQYIKTPAARKYHNEHKWVLNGNVIGAHAHHVQKLKELSAEKLTTLKQFIEACTFGDHQLIYEVFEEQCSDELRAQIYSLADADTPEPFRSAMHNIGFTDY